MLHAIHQALYNMQDGDTFSRAIRTERLSVMRIYLLANIMSHWILHWQSQVNYENAQPLFYFKIFISNIVIIKPGIGSYSNKNCGKPFIIIYFGQIQ